MSVFYYQAIDLILKSWAENPKLTKRQIGVWSHWKADDPENDKPSTPEEIQKYKNILEEKRLRMKKLKRI